MVTPEMIDKLQACRASIKEPAITDEQLQRLLDRWFDLGEKSLYEAVTGLIYRLRNTEKEIGKTRAEWILEYEKNLKEIRKVMQGIHTASAP